jgi:hypothetical protein
MWEWIGSEAVSGILKVVIIVGIGALIKEIRKFNRRTILTEFKIIAILYSLARTNGNGTFMKYYDEKLDELMEEYKFKREKSF